MPDFWYPLHLAPQVDIMLHNRNCLEIYLDPPVLAWLKEHAPLIVRAVETAQPDLDEYEIVSGANQLGCRYCFCWDSRRLLPDKDKLIIVANSRFASANTKQEAVDMLARLAERDEKKGRWRKARSEIGARRAALLKALVERDGYRCTKCGAEKDLHIDHIVPVSAGGTNQLSNLQFLCRPCNIAKGARNGE